MDIIVCLLLFAGLFFFTGGAVGILRFPDFYSRLHPALNNARSLKKHIVRPFLLKAPAGKFVLGGFGKDSIRNAKSNAPYRVWAV